MNEDQPLSDDQAAAIGVAGLCCCLLALVGVGVIIFFLIKKSGAKGGAPAQQPPGVYQPVSEVMHLSVLALGLDASIRDGLDAQLTAPLTSPGPVQARVELVQRFAQLLLSVQPAWRYFGYGEKDLGDLFAAEQSYGHALADFRQRSGFAGQVGGGVAVLTLVLATRTPLAGATRLDDAAQVREVLQNRARLDSAVLLGAETVWAPVSGGMSDDTLVERFPEMHGLIS